ncbi:MAG: hypothetical protein JW798_11735 [Prolixibacteraceae bacterium]|nr:hypothetical protein [Prolixibacteraceae bacterium]
MKQLRLFKIVLIIAVFVQVFVACESFPTDPPEKTANEYIYEKFLDWYLWYEQIPDIDPNGIESEEALIDSIKFPDDRWSFTAPYSEVLKWYQSGEYTGFGAGFVIDSDRIIKISLVYENSPLGRNGVERGWKVLSINGFTTNEIDSVNAALSSNGEVLFEMEDHQGGLHSFTATREAISANSVLYSEVLNVDGHNIGYFVLNSFIGTSPDELRTVIDSFNNDNITDLIVDLRYNGGGLNNAAYQLVGMIGGELVKGQVISSLIHNDKHTDKDVPTTSAYDGPVFEAQNVYFITTGRTASASELVINSLEPYTDVTLVGSDTHGKPVGMYIFKVEKLDLAILPISFKSINSMGYGDYYNGLPVDIAQTDDLDHNWGDPEEAMLKKTLDFIVNPALSLTQPTLKKQQVLQFEQIQYKGIHRLTGAY